MKNNIIWIALFLTIVFIIFLYVFPHLNGENNGCYLHKEVYVQEIRSKIEKKFINTPNHALKKIIYLDHDSNENELVFTAEYKGMYDSLSVGDSIIKKRGTLDYEVKSKATGKLMSLPLLKSYFNIFKINKYFDSFTLPLKEESNGGVLIGVLERSEILAPTGTNPFIYQT